PGRISMTRTRCFAQVAMSIGLALAAPAAALAQGGDSGAIIGYVFDQTGAPIPGVKVTITSPTQLGGKKVGYTNSEGAFRFPALVPGTFSLKAEAPKLQSYVQENIKV